MDSSLHSSLTPYPNNLSDEYLSEYPLGSPSPPQQTSSVGHGQTKAYAEKCHPCSALVAHFLDDLEFQLFKIPLVTQHGYLFFFQHYLVQVADGQLVPLQRLHVRDLQRLRSVRVLLLRHDVLRCLRLGRLDDRRLLLLSTHGHCYRSRGARGRCARRVQGATGFSWRVITRILITGNVL